MHAMEAALPTPLNCCCCADRWKPGKSLLSSSRCQCFLVTLLPHSLPRLSCKPLLTFRSLTTSRAGAMHLKAALVDGKREGGKTEETTEEELVETWELNSLLATFSDQNRAFFENASADFINTVLDAGCLSNASDILVMLGSELFVDELCNRCPRVTIEVVDFSLDVLATIKEKHDDVRCWCIHSLDIPEILGTSMYDIVFLNYFPIFSGSLPNLLNDIGLHCKHGGTVVISLACDKKSLLSFKENNKHIVKALLPEKDELIVTLRGSCFRILSFTEVPGFYQAVLKKEFPLHLSGEVVRGVGRGSKQLGFPTANLSVDGLPCTVKELEKGVYYGWAQVVATGFDKTVYPVVMNIGSRPTFEKDDSVLLEAHILHDFGADFYGREIRVAIMGFIRTETKFSSVDELISRIKDDIKCVEMCLSGANLDLQRNSFFL